MSDIALRYKLTFKDFLSQRLHTKRAICLYTSFMTNGFPGLASLTVMLFAMPVIAYWISAELIYSNPVGSRRTEGYIGSGMAIEAELSGQVQRKQERKEDSCSA